MSVCKWRIGLAVPLLALGMGSAQAAMLEGGTVSFSFSGNFGLFGDPSVVGDTLVFNPIAFDADVAGVDGDLARAMTPVITITAKANYVIDDVELAESGSYFRIDPTADGTATLVGAGGDLIVNGTSVSFNAGGLGVFQSPADVDANGLSLVHWAAEAEVEDLGALLATVQVDNVLVALAGASRRVAMSFIDMQGMELEVETAVIPIPAAVWLFGSALIGLSVVGRRRLAA